MAPERVLQNMGSSCSAERKVLSLAGIDAQLLYAAPSHLVCTISGYRQ
jgi:hypothetical protein